MCWGRRPDGNVYSLNIPALGKKRNIPFLDDSVPITATDPDIIANARLFGAESGVGIAHSRNVLVAGSRWAILLPADSTNQQHLPDGSNAKPVGWPPTVGMVHSVSAALVASEAKVAPEGALGTISRGASVSMSKRTANILTGDEQLMNTSPFLSLTQT